MPDRTEYDELGDLQGMPTGDDPRTCSVRGGDFAERPLGKSDTPGM